MIRYTQDGAIDLGDQLMVAYSSGYTGPTIVELADDLRDANAERARLREALRRIINLTDSGMFSGQIARAALAEGEK